MAKIGVEVEGRFKGLPTLFISAEELLQIQDKLDGLDDLKNHYGLYQIYISDLGNNLEIGYPKMDLDLFERLSIWFIVTVELTAIGLYYAKIPDKINLVLNTELTEPLRMKPTDQVKFSQGQNVLMTTVESLIKTVPSDFEGDHEIDLLSFLENQ